jgi:hypothetical protein
MSDLIRARLREVIGVASHLDGLVCEEGKSLPPDVAAVVLEDVSKMAMELGWLADDVELRLPKRMHRPKSRRSGEHRL